MKKKKTQDYINILKDGNNLALVSNAGTPVINDPGFLLIKYAYDNNIRVVPLPGSCAAITALSASGLQSNKFCYEGFLSKKKQLCQNQIKKLSEEKRTIILYESPKRLINTIKLIKKIMGKKRKILVAKEITKKWENIQRGAADKILDKISNDDNWKKGEITIIINGIKEKKIQSIPKKIFKIINIIKKETSVSSAIKIVSKIYGYPKNILYNAIINKFKKVD